MYIGARETGPGGAGVHVISPVNIPASFEEVFVPFSCLSFCRAAIELGPITYIATLCIELWGISSRQLSALWQYFNPNYTVLIRSRIINIYMYLFWFLKVSL